MKDLYTVFGRSISVITAVVLLCVIISEAKVFAIGGQVQYRSIQLSDNGVSLGSISTGVGSGTGVSYRVTFDAASTYTLKGVVVDFCAGTGGTPFIGDSACAALTNFTVGGTPTVNTTSPYTENSVTADGLGSGWTTSSLNSGQTFRMTNATGATITAGDRYTFTISGVTNTSVKGSFYARLITYTSDTGDIANYTHSSPGDYQDYGGFALSLANIIQVSAKVQETLVFCVLGSTTPDPDSPTAPTGCTDPAATAPAITLGHGDNNTLDFLQVDKNQVFTYASTNALSGVTIRMHNANDCGGLRIAGTLTCGIPPVNGGAATTPTTGMPPGTAAFGVSVSSNPDIIGQAPYNGDPANNFYGMDTTTVGANATTTFGSPILKSTGPVANSSNMWTFAATAGPTTAAGIYTANIAAIATGTF